ncbi:MAG: type IV secretion system DNA-binding domain-containing protein, partial [Rubrivivax sp.]|nr:type IV secretion system DNA-binding domain-containing protein [Rubrivivax sp.]
ENLLTLAGVWVPPADETKHFKLIGTTGAGKSTAIRELLHQALQRGDRAVIADPDGGYLASFYDRGRGDVILNPFDARSRKWSVFADIGNIQDADLMARSLIPDTGSTGNSAREWSGYARTFVSAVLRQCMANGEMDSAELWRLIAVASTDELRTLLAGTAAQPFLEADNARMFGSIRSVAANAIATLEYVHAQEGHAAFSVRQWVRSGRGVLYLPYQAEQIAALRTLIATWVRLAIFQTMGLGEGDHRIWFVVDELDALGPIDGLKDALARLRKFGGRCVLGFQSIAQVSSTYGDGPARTIVENCSNTLILRCSASEGGGTAKFASQLIGQREVIRPTVTHSTGIEGKFIGREVDRGTSYGEEHRVEDAVMASEIEALPDRVGYLKFASRPAWTLVGFEYFEPDGRVKVFQAV